MKRIICFFLGHLFHSIKKKGNEIYGFSIISSNGEKYCLRCGRYFKR